MKRAKSVNVTNPSDGNESIFSLIPIAVFATISFLTVNIFFLDTKPVLDGKGGAEVQTSGLFGLVFPGSEFPIIVVSVAISIMLLALLMCIFNASGYMEEEGEDLNAILVFLTLMGDVLMIVVSVVMTIVMLFVSPDENPYEDLFEDVIEQEHSPRNMSSIYTISTEAYRSGGMDKFIESLDSSQEEVKPVDNGSLIDAIEKKRVEQEQKEDDPSYSKFIIAEVEKGEFHLFSYDSDKSIKHVSDVIDLGEIDKKDLSEFEGLVSQLGKD